MYKKIAIPDPNTTLEIHREQLQQLSQQTIDFYSAPATDLNDFISRCSGADAIVVGWASKVPAEVIEACPELKHIALACTLFTGPGSNVDMEAARKADIIVTGVRDYGDIGVAEWVLSEIIQHIQNHAPRRELRGYKVGVVGAGGAGAPTALLLQRLGADVSYFSRSNKIAMEKAGIPRLELEDLFAWSEALTFHLPRNTMLGGAELISKFSGSIIINTSLGLPLEAEAVSAWLDNEDHFCAFDVDGIGSLEEYKKHSRVRYLPYNCGFTSEAQERLVEGVVGNLKAGLK